MASSTSVDLTPPYIEFTVLAGEPHTVLLPITNQGEPIDLATDYPNLVSRLQIGTDVPIETPVTVESASVARVDFPAMERGNKVSWELRDSDTDRTWLTGRINVAKDALPQ